MDCIKKYIYIFLFYYFSRLWSCRVPFALALQVNILCINFSDFVVVYVLEFVNLN